MILRITGLVVVALIAASGQGADDAAMKAFREAIQKVESVADNKGVYDDASMKKILVALDDCFSRQAALILNAQLEFSPRYRETPERIKTVHTSNRKDRNYKQLGDDKTVVTTTIDSKKVQSGYIVTGGDVAVLRQAEAFCFSIKQAMKDTPLASTAVRRKWPVLKNAHILLDQVPAFVRRYLALDGEGTARFDDQLARVEELRKQLAAVFKEYRDQAADLRKIDTPSK